MVGHVLRFHPAFEKLKELIDAGELGEVKYIHSHRLASANSIPRTTRCGIWRRTTCR